MTKKTEKDLVLEYKTQKATVAKAEEILKDAKKGLYAAEASLLEHLEATGAEKTATYEGIGHVTRSKPRLYARCNKEDETYLFQFLKDIGRDDLIKETVRNSSLSSLVAERVESGENVPDYIPYYLKSGVLFYDNK